MIAARISWSSVPRSPKRFGEPLINNTCVGRVQWNYFLCIIGCLFASADLLFASRAVLWRGGYPNLRSHIGPQGPGILLIFYYILWGEGQSWIYSRTCD